MNYNLGYYQYLYYRDRRCYAAARMIYAFTQKHYEIAGVDAGYCLDRVIDSHQ